MGGDIVVSAISHEPSESLGIWSMLYPKCGKASDKGCVSRKLSNAASRKERGARSGDFGFNGQLLKLSARVGIPYRVRSSAVPCLTLGQELSVPRHIEGDDTAIRHKRAD